MAASDRERLLRFLAELRVSIAGSHSAVVHRALAEGASRDPRQIVLLAERDAELVGIALGTLDPKRFWREFALRHPLLILERIPALIRRRLRRRGGQSQAAADASELSALLSQPSGRKWMESSPQIGHVTLILLHPSVRGNGLSVPLLRRLLEELAAAGATRVDARIARGNIASLRAFHRCGMSLEPDGANVFATVDSPRGQA